MIFTAETMTNFKNCETKLAYAMAQNEGFDGSLQEFSDAADAQMMGLVKHCPRPAQGGFALSGTAGWINESG